MIEGVVAIESEWTGRRRERMGLALRVKIVPTLSPKDGDKGSAGCPTHSRRWNEWE